MLNGATSNERKVRIERRSRLEGLRRVRAKIVWLMQLNDAGGGDFLPRPDAGTRRTVEALVRVAVPAY